jgi:hypothetical protein
MLVGYLLLGACAGTPGRQRAEAYRFDTVTNACRQNPANCVLAAGKESAGHTVVAAGTRAYAVVRALEDLDKELIEAALVECADLARSEVLLRHRQDFAGQSPSREECNQQVKDAAGRLIRRAMQLGTEMHQVARKCAEERLGQLRPGEFSLEPHYRYDSRSEQTKHIPEQDVAALRESGNGGELLGTLVPDVVIHDGNPLHVQAVYDFKFPCFHLDGMPRWDTYPPGHPHQNLDQGRLYRTALRAPAARVAPRIGVQR